MSNQPSSEIPAPPIPRSFWEYLRSFGPGLVVVLTWLGAGDIVETGVAGGNYGYALMWIIVVALVVRYLFVSLIAKYQLCNERGEGVLDGLARLSRVYPLGLLVVSIVMGHVYGAYMTVGNGEAWANMTGVGQTWQWAILWSVVALFLVFRPIFSRIEVLFLILLALLAISFLGIAAWAGPNFKGILRGIFGFELPEKKGAYDALLVVIGMLGAVGGSLMNLVYPYFIEQKGWRGPAYRKLQRYDFMLGVIVMIVLDVAIWTVGAELLYGRGATIRDTADLSGLVSNQLGRGGNILFYLGVFAAVYTSIIGHALGLGLLGAHGYLRWQAGDDRPLNVDYRNHPLYRWIAIWILVSPLVWTVPGMPGFVRLTLLSNSAQVVLVPVLVIGLFWITASSKYIGEKYRNRWWENVIMILMLVISVFGFYGSVKSVWGELSPQEAKAENAQEPEQK